MSKLLKSVMALSGLGCASHLCVIDPPTGQGTNGPCHCLHPVPAPLRFRLMALLRSARAAASVSAELIATAKLLREAADVLSAHLDHNEAQRRYTGPDRMLIAELRGRANLLDPASATPIPPCP